MKKFIIFTMLMIMAINTFSQQTNPSHPLTRADYLQKSKSQKTVGWIMLGGGVAITTIGLVTANEQVNDDPFGYFVSDKASGSTILLLAGIGTALGSIPFFIAAGKNRRKAAASVSFKMENKTNIYQCAVSTSRYPAVVVQFRL